MATNLPRELHEAVTACDVYIASAHAAAGKDEEGWIEQLADRIHMALAEIAEAQARRGGFVR